jgi:hypothetical protein
MKKTYHGSCECEKVTLEVNLDLSAGTFKCNCRICTKARFWGAAVGPDDLKVLSGEDSITTYWTNPIHHFCKHCGIKLFGRGHTPDGTKMAAIALACLDDLDPKEWASAPVFVCNGREDRFDQPAPFSAHL